MPSKYLIRPGPDPTRKEETEWLTKEKIEEESTRQTYNWTDIGSGTLGKVFVEVRRVVVVRQILDLSEI